MLGRRKKIFLILIFFLFLLIGLSFFLPSKSLYNRIQHANDLLEEVTPIIITISPAIGAAFVATEKVLDGIQAITDKQEKEAEEELKDKAK